ncbi:MAG TPA: hypothetical protein VF559_09550 [Caulobacteraceae bacterium]
MRIAVAGLVLTILSGCATPSGPPRETEYQRLARECREQGGYFQAMPGTNTGRPETDNACVFSGPPPRR